MTFESATTYPENAPEPVAPQFAQGLGRDNGTTSRKHFLKSYAEHLEALRNARPAK